MQVSGDGATWQDVGEAEYDPITNAPLTKATISSIPASMTYVQFLTTAGTAQRVNVDDIGIYFGSAAPTLDYTGSTTGTAGEQMQLVFTLNGGTASGWTYTLESAGREELDTGNVNTFTWTPPFAGTFYLTMTALDEAVEPIATREVTLTVNAAGRPPIATITVVPGGGGDFTFDVPAGYALRRVEGATPAQLAANTWMELAENTDYTVSGATVRILTTASVGRAVRIWIQ